MAWLPKCAVLQEGVGRWEWVDMMVLYCQRSAVEDHEFARRINVLLQEMTDTRDDMVDFVHGLEAVPGVIAAVKVAGFLNETLVKDDKRLQKSQNMEIEADFYVMFACCNVGVDYMCSALKAKTTKSMAALPRAISEDTRLVREINGLFAGLTTVIKEIEHLIDKLDVLVDRFMPEKMAEFLKETMAKDTKKLMKLQILGREFELRAHEKNLFIKKLKGDMDF
ncbi:hypothetical protein Tco_0710594 [Tanacetum coccineum]